MTGGQDGTTTTANPTTGVDGDTAMPGETAPPVYFDLGIIPDSPEFCTEGDGEVQFSYIWIANSSQSDCS